jgi:hypothetical protein
MQFPLFGKPFEKIAPGYCYTVTAECEKVFSLLKWATPKRQNLHGEKKRK